MKRVVFICFLIFTSVWLRAQDASLPRIAVGDFYIYSGSHTGSFDMDITDFSKLAPESEVLGMDLSYYKKNYLLQRGDGNYLSVKLGLNFVNKEGNEYRLNPQLQIGFTYMTNNTAQYGIHLKETQRVDTLASVSTSNVVYVDSIYSSNIQTDYWSDNLLLDIALMYRTDVESRWSFFGGFGIAGGVSLKSRTDIFHTETEALNFIIPGNENEFSMQNSAEPVHTIESFSNSLNVLAFVQLPLGVNFKVAKSTKFWKDLNMFYEITPLLKYWNIPEAGSYITVGIKHGIGFKLNIG